MKRAREVQVISTDPWQFHLNGRVVGLEELLSTTYIVGVVDLLKRFTHEQLRLFQSASRLANAFVERHNIWQHLVARDYPEQYKVVFDGEGMRQVTKDRLDVRSNNPGNKRTYWKRYYEYLFKTVDNPSVFEDLDNLIWVHAVHPNLWFFRTEDVDQPLVVQFRDRYWRLPGAADRRTLIPKEQFDAYQNKVRIKFPITPYAHIIIDDGLLVNMFVDDKKVLWVFKAENKVLVSCRICASPTELMCPCCEIPYCGKGCQHAREEEDI